MKKGLRKEPLFTAYGVYVGFSPYLILCYLKDPCRILCQFFLHWLVITSHDLIVGPSSKQLVGTYT